MKPLSASDLPIVDGKIYHLNIRPEQLAKDILIVGDPDRVPAIAMEHFRKTEVDVFHRGLRTITGVTKSGMRITAVTSGMGTPSLEIVANEIYALNEIDLATRKLKQRHDTINIIRVGTAGGLQKKTALGTPIITSYAVGLDNTGLFYDAGYASEKCKEIEAKVRKALDAVVRSKRFKGAIVPYASMADPSLVAAMEESAKELGIKYLKGITVSNAGFFANQGRNISRIPLTVPDIDGVLASLGEVVDGLKIENLEMESSFLLHFMGALGYRSGVICPAIANRRTDSFASDYAKDVSDATKIAISALEKMRKNKKK